MLVLLVKYVWQEVTPSEVISQIVEVNKYFRNHHVPDALLSEITGHVTRWNSPLTCVDIYIRNKPFVLLVIVQNEDLIENTKHGPQCWSL
jgi:hypothetical protein